MSVVAEDWFEYIVKVHPHHTDYAGMVWHGTYLTWMEEARIECLRSLGIDFADLVAAGCNLPVVEVSIRYHQPMRMGMEAVIKTRIGDMEGVRIYCDYQIQSLSGDVLFLTGRITIVAVDLANGKVMRRLPPAMKDALEKMR
nr:thioesterase family protein [Myxacorys almedinensis]